MSNYRVPVAGTILTAQFLMSQQDLFVYKPSDQSVNNTVALVNDTALTFASLPAGATYELTSLLIGTSATSGTPNIKLGWSSSGSTLAWSPNAQSTLMTTDSDGGTRSIFSNIGTTRSWGVLNGLTTGARPFGVLVTTTATSLTLQWAQNTATAENTTIKTGSWLLLRRIA